MSFLERLAGTKRIYMDYAAATPVVSAASEAMQAVQEQVFANPGALHHEGVAAAEALLEARKRIARMLECKAGQLVFVSGGTEGNNLAVFGAVRAAAATGTPHNNMHVITSAIEHPSLLEPFKELERHGMRVTYVLPDSRGVISADALAQALTPETVMVSIGWVNSEIGVVQPLSALTETVRAYEAEHNTTIIFHTDAGQGPLYLASQVHGLGVDMMTLDSGKLYGPRGVGALFVRDKAQLQPIMFGGGQESALRPGSENVALATGFAAAYEHISSMRVEEAKRMTHVRSTFTKQLKRAVPDAVVHGNPKRATPHIVNISIPDIDSEYILFALDHAGIAISTKSSCREGEEDSHVVAALGGESWYAATTLRFSFGINTSVGDAVHAVALLAGVLKKYRSVQK